MQTARIALTLAASTLAVLCWSSAPAAAQDPSTEMLSAINARRAASGLAPLLRDARLDAAAQSHAAYMAAHDALSHVTDDTGTPADRIRSAGVSAGEIAENVAMHHTAMEAQQSLEASAPHLGNMMSDRFTHIGLAAAPDEAGVYVTQVFARIEPSAPEVVAAPPAADPVVVEAAPEPQWGAPSAPGPQIVIPMTPDPSAPPSPPIVSSVPPSAAPAQGGQVQVIVPRPDGRPLAGYWVCHADRWWYYPMPPGAVAGQQLQADLRVTGAPPGYHSSRCAAGTPIVTIPPPAQPPVYARPAPPVYMPPPPVYSPPVYARPMPPPPPPRVIYTRPRPGTVIAPYGVQVELGVGPLRGRLRIGGRRGRR